MNVQKAFAQIEDRLKKAREEIAILEEQLFFQIDVLEEANTRMVVAETPLAEREYRVAKDDHARLEQERTRVLATIEELKHDQDKLLDLLASKA
jgi:hypothetical protein